MHSASPGGRNKILVSDVPLLRAPLSKTDLMHLEILRRGNIRNFLQGGLAEIFINPDCFQYITKMPHVRTIKPSIFH